MVSNEPSGAVDADYDDAARDGVSVLRDKLAEFPRAIEAQDIVIDLVQGRPLYVRRQVADTAADYFDDENFDLTTYKAHPWLPVGPDDPIYECVFLPTKPEDIPSSKGDKTYDYPRGRLARVPVEWLYGTDTHRHTEHVIATLSQLIDVAADDHYRQEVVDVAIDTFGTEWTDTAIEVAGFDPSKYGADADHRGAVNANAEDGGEETRSEPPNPQGSTDDTDDLGDFEV